MLVTDESCVRRGVYGSDKMWTALLVGETNSGSREISIQVTHVDMGGAQGIHSHPEDQCYYVIEGNGSMRIADEVRKVGKGDAIFIPGGQEHGITNNGSCVLTYLTANKPFGIENETRIWNQAPALPE